MLTLYLALPDALLIKCLKLSHHESCKRKGHCCYPHYRYERLFGSGGQLDKGSCMYKGSETHETIAYPKERIG